MPYQHPLVVRYDDEGRADGLKETNYLVVSSISAADWVGLPTAGGSVSVTAVPVGEIYFRQDTNVVSGITLPDNNTSGYLNVSTNDAGVPFYSWGPGGTGGGGSYAVNEVAIPDTNSVWTFNGLNAQFITPTELNTALGSYAQTTALATYLTITNAASTYIANSLLTTNGDIIYRGAGSVKRLSAGTDGQVLQTTGSESNKDLTWTTLNYLTQATADARYVEIADAPSNNSIYFKNNLGAASGIAAATGYLRWNGSQFIWDTPTGVTTLDQLNDVNVPSPQPDQALVYKGSQWVASSISTLDAYLNLQTSTQNISTVVNTINSNYVNTTQFNNLSTLISETYVSGTEFDQLVTSAAQISAVVNTINSNYLTTTAANATYVNVAGDTMTGDLFIDGTNSIKFTNPVGGISAINNINFYSPTTFYSSTVGLSANNINSYTNIVVGVSAPFIPNDPGYNHTNTGANYNLDVLTYLRQLDRLLYRHAENYNNPTNDNTTGHWALSALRTKTVNLLSATDASALKDINYPTTPSNGQVLTWSTGTNSWVNQSVAAGANALSALTTDVNITTAPPGGYVLKWDANTNKWVPGVDKGSFTELLDSTQANHILILSSNLEDIEVSNWDISSIELHLGNIDQVDGAEIHHYLSSLDQRYLPASGVFSGVVAVQALSSVDYIEFDLSANVAREEGRLYWNDTYKTLELDSANQTSIFLGQEIVVRVLNNTAQTFTRGQVVYISGTQSNIPTIALATASAEATTHKGLGVLKQTLTSGQRGLMSTFGLISGVDTSIYSTGDILYLGITPGTLTNVYAAAPSHPELIGSVVTVGTSSTGSILVQVQHGYEINELHNVSRTPASATGQVLVWNDASGYYEPGSHNNLAGLTVGNPHTQYATLSGATFTGPVDIYRNTAIAEPLLDISGIWNTPSAVTALKLNITDTSSNSGSLLMDLQVGGSSKFSVIKDGSISLGGINVNNGVSHGFIKDNGLVLVGNNAAANNNKTTTYNAIVRTDGFWVNQSLPIGWIEPNAYSTDTTLRRVSPGVISATSSVFATSSFNVESGAANGSRGYAIGGIISLTQISSKFSVLSIGDNEAYPIAFGPGGATNPTQLWAELRKSGFLLNSSMSLGWTSGDISTSVDLRLHRDSTNILAQRNGANNPQTFRLYNTYTDASNYERAGFNWNNNTFEIETEAGGTGVARNLTIGTSGVPRMQFSGTGARIDTSALFTITTNNDTSVLKIQNNSNTKHAGWEFCVGQPGLYDGYLMIRKDGSSLPGFMYVRDTGGVTFTQGAAVGDNTYFSNTNYGSLAFYAPYIANSTCGQLSFRNYATNQSTFEFKGFFYDGVSYTGHTNLISMRLNSATDARVGISTGVPDGKFSISDTQLCNGGSLATPLLDMTQTWNTAGIPTAIKLNITDTSSNSASLLMNLQVGGSSKFKVGKDGTITSTGGIYTNARSSFSGNLLIETAGTRVGNSRGLGFSPAAAPGDGAGNDAVLFYDGEPWTIGQRAYTGQVTQSQKFRIYNAYTNASNFERAGLNWNASAFEIETEASGTGIARNLTIGTSGVPRMVFSGTGDRIDSSGMFVAGTIYPGNQTTYSIRNNSNRIEFWSTTGKFFSADSQNEVVVPTNGKIGFGPGNTDASIFRVRSGVIGVTSALEALSSITAPVVSATNITGVNTYATLVSATDISAVNYYGNQISKSISIINPSSTENITIFNANEDYEIVEMVAVLRGSSTPSITWTVRKDPSRAGTGTEVVTGGTSTTSTTTGSVVTSFNSNTIPNGNFVWLAITAKSGTVDEYHLTVHMKKVSGLGGV